MAKFGKRSLEKLQTCDSRLRQICHKVITIYDFSILSGYRDKEEQNALFNEGKSKLRYPDSKHNNTPSTAIDIAPWPIDWDDLARFYLLAGMMFSTAKANDIRLRWGGDWNCNWNLKDQDFFDLPHFELIDI